MRRNNDNNNDKKDNQKIRKYRILRRKAKRLKKERIILKFILNKIIPFAVIRFFLKKFQFSSITVGFFLLTLLFNFFNSITEKEFTKSKEYQIEILQTKKELNSCKTLIENQQLLIIDLQKEIFNWSIKFKELEKTKENELQKITKQYQSDQEKVNQENIKLKSNLDNFQHKLKTQNRQQNKLIDQLKLRVTAKDDEIKLKDLEIKKQQLEIDELKEKLRNQELEFYKEFQDIRTELNDLSSAVSDIKVQNRLKLISVLIERILRTLKF